VVFFLVRPKKFRNGFTTMTLMRINDCKQVYEQAEELAKREKVSFSELVVKALADYCKVHYPGQPQPPLPLSSSLMDDYVFRRVKARLEHLLGKPWVNREAWLLAVDNIVLKLKGVRGHDAEREQLLQLTLEKAK